MGVFKILFVELKMFKQTYSDVFAFDMLLDNFVVFGFGDDLSFFSIMFLCDENKYWLWVY